MTYAMSSGAARLGAGGVDLGGTGVGDTDARIARDDSGVPVAETATHFTPSAHGRTGSIGFEVSATRTPACRRIVRIRASGWSALIGRNARPVSRIASAAT